MLKSNNIELILWISCLTILIFINPHAENHSTFCIFKNLGIEFCPGCGLGRSIALIYHGELSESLKVHPLGLPALAIIIWRVISLLYMKFAGIKIITGGRHG